MECIFLNNKGYRGRSEIATLMFPVLNSIYKRYGNKYRARIDLMRALSGRCDYIGIDWMAAQIKRCECNDIDVWWQKSIRLAKKHQEAVLLYRRNNTKWRVRMIGSFGSNRGSKQLETVVDFGIKSFMEYFLYLSELEIIRYNKRVKTEKENKEENYIKRLIT